jgi:putative ABC transport system permease protein
MVSLQLAKTNLWVHRGRTMLTTAAIALSVSLVVAVTSGYASVEKLAMHFVDKYMGSADLVITERRSSVTPFSEKIVDMLRADPQVKRVTGRWETETPLQDKTGKTIEQHPAQLIGLRRPIDTRVESLEPNVGKWFDTPDGNFAVIDQVAADKMSVGVGGTFTLKHDDRTLKLTVTGIVQKPQILAEHVQSIYIPLGTMQKFLAPNDPPGVTRVMVDLKPGVDTKAFAARWSPIIEKFDKGLSVELGRDVKDKMEKNLQGLHILSYLGGTVSMMAATFIIFSALSMGVTERSRTLAMLRAIGASRGQVGAIVIIEGLLLAIVGVSIGTPLGWTWLFLLHLKYSHVFPAGIALSWGGILYAGIGSLTAALAASLLPAWWATRVRPLEAMAPSAEPPSRKAPLWAGLAGLVLVVIDPLILFLPWETWFPGTAGGALLYRLVLHFVFGIPSFMLGFFLLGPAFVVLLEKLASPVVSLILGLDPGLLRQQLSSGLWRSAGTGAALMVGLAILIAMETEGNSMLKGWTLPDRFPDIFIVSWNTPLHEAEIDKIRHVPGIRAGEVLPIAVAAPNLGGSGLASLALAAVIPDSTMFLGVDPALAMKMMELTFIQGNQADAIRLMNAGPNILITDELSQAHHLNLNDKMKLKTAHQGEVNFTVVGVVAAPGMDLVNSQFDMGKQFDQRTSGSVFGSMSSAKKYFDANDIHLVAADLDAGVSKEAVMKSVADKIGNMGLQAGDVRGMKEKMTKAFGEVLLVISAVPFGAMAVASLGVTNTIMASVRTRRWQLGVLRAIGLTRSQLLRLILGESILIGVVGVAMGIAAAALLIADGHEMNRLATGYHPNIAIPWGIVTTGIVAVVVVATLGGLYPALSVSRTEPLRLLQSGRAAA